MDKEILAQMDDAVAYVEQSADPAPETLYEDVYVRSPYIHQKSAEKDPAWKAAVREDRVPEVFPPFDYAAWKKTKAEIAAAAPPPEPAAEPPAATAGGGAPPAPGVGEEVAAGAPGATPGGKPDVDRRPARAATRRWIPRATSSGARRPPESRVDMAILTMRAALNQALKEEMVRDPSVFILGEEVGAYQGAYKITQGLLAQFGEWRVRDTPIAEEAIAGIAVGAAFTGMRPIAEMMTFNFSLLALDQIVNHAAKYRYMSAGQIRCPMVMRGPSGAATQVSAQHSQTFEAWYAHLPGLVVATPSHPQGREGDAEERDPGRQPGDLPGERDPLQLQGRGAGRGVPHPPRAWRREARGQRRHDRGLEPVGHDRAGGGQDPGAEGIEAEVVDPRTLRPSTTTSSSSRCARRTGAWWSRRGGASPGSAPRSPTACSASASTTSTRRSSA